MLTEFRILKMNKNSKTSLEIYQGHGRRLL